MVYVALSYGIAAVILLGLLGKTLLGYRRARLMGRSARTPIKSKILVD